MKTKLLALILALLMVTSMVPVSAIQMVLPETAAETTVTIPEATEEIATVAAETNIYEKYGTKIFHEDFTDFEDGTVLISKNNDATGYTTLDDGAALISTFSGNAKDAMTVTTFDGNKVVKVDVPTAKSGALYYIYVNMPSLTFTEGKYYALSRYYFVPDQLSQLNIVYDTSFIATAAGTTGTSISKWYPNAATDNRWCVYSRSVEVTSSNKSSMKNYAFYNTQPSTTNGGYYYLDDLAVYYKPTRTASYVLDGGSGTFDSFTYYDYEAVTLPETAPTKTGSEFAGWKASTSGKTYAAGATIPADEIGKATDALTLTAVWKSIEDVYVNEYGKRIFFSDFEDIEANTIPANVALINTAYGHTATFSSSLNNAADDKDIYVVSYNGSNMAKIISKSGSWASPFLRVETETTAGGKYTLVADFYSDTTNNASGNAASLINNGASNQVLSPNGAIPAGGTYKKVQTHVNPEGTRLYRFDWTVNGTSSAGAAFYVDNIALYFKPTRTATYDLDGGSGTFDSFTYYDYEALTLPEATPTKTGYAFVGWQASTSGNIYAAGATIPAADIGKATDALTLTAIWEEVFTRPYNEAYGESIFYDDFETVELDTTITGTPRYVADGHTVKYVNNASISIAEYNGSKMAKFVKTEAQASWWGGPHLSIDVNLGMTGKYTVYADYYAPEGCTVTTDARITLNGAADNSSVRQYAGNSKYAYSFVLSENKQRFAYVAGIQNASSVYTPFHLDNIELFFKPTRTVSFSANGGTGTAPTLTYYDYEDLTLPENTYTKSGYVFAGWKSSLDGVTYAEGAAIPAASIGKADADLTLTAVWEAVVLNAGHEIKTTAPAGIRFKGYVEDREASNVVEYGFIVALKSSFTDGDYSALVFPEGYDSVKGTNGKLANGKPFVNGVCFSSDTGLDKIYGMTGDLGAGNYFSCVLTNMATAEQYKSYFAARPYVKIGTEYFYGDVVVENILNLAQSYDDQANEFVQGIIDACN